MDLQQQVHKTIVLVTHDIDEALKLADRIALMNVGGVLEQFASPDELLRDPANEFVERFVGEDRVMKRLQLATVADLPFHQGPVVVASATPAEAREVMRASGSSWVGLTDRGAFLGWVHGPDVHDDARLTDAPRSLPAAQVGRDSTLRRAMEIIMTSRTSVAVVDDDGRFGGVITLEQIRAGLDQGPEIIAA
jgi:osmoprotectant transport system ATP-binding protein